MTWLTKTVGDWFGKPQLKEDSLIGLEIEMESSTEFPPIEDVKKYWASERDGSLRGDYSTEYILKGASSRKRVVAALGQLDGALDEWGTEVNDSVRAGIHVHINVRDLTLKEMLVMVTYWYVLEEILIGMVCGEGRSGNHFCLRAVDSDLILYELSTSIQNKSFGNLNTDDLRYTALNYCSLFKFGSLEFRAMRTTRDFSKVLEWIDILCKIKDSHKLSPDPRHVIQNFSEGGEWNFIKDVLGVDTARKIVEKDPMYRHKLRKGVRLAQEIAYSIDDWNVLTGPENPFGITTEYKIKVPLNEMQNL